MNLGNSKDIELKVIELSLDAKNKEAAKILGYIEDLNKDIEEATSNYDKGRFTRLRAEKEEELKPIIEVIKNLEWKREQLLNQTNFPKKLFQYFIDFDFKSQRKAYSDYLDQAENIKIGSFLIHSEGNYDAIRDQEWLWKCILLSYLDSPNKDKLTNFFRPRQNGIRDIFYDFQVVIDNSFEDRFDSLEENITQEEIEELAIPLEEKLKTQNIIIPVYLSKDWLTYPLIYTFFEQIWEPLCEILAIREDKSHWLKLFIIDNEVVDEDGKDYHVTNIEESIISFRPYKLDRVLLNPSDFESWMEVGKTNPDKVFHKFRRDCKAFTYQFQCEEHYIKYLPPCKTVEKLFDKICLEIPDNLIKINLKKLIKQYAGI